jgi:predicted Zn finger-like uncharacterized protein
MILTCPACATRYQADEAKFPLSGRTVRCAKCGHSWHQPGPESQAPAAATESPAAAIAAPAPESPPAEQPRAEIPLRARIAAAVPEPSPRPWLPMLGVALGWIGLIAVVLLIGFSAVRYRQEITAVWPQSAGVYSRLGLPVKSQGIDFAHVEYHREDEDGQTVLAVTGQIVNTGARELPVPQTVLITLKDAANKELYHWTFTPQAKTLPAGEGIGFRTRLSSPPAAARNLEVRFAQDSK